MSSADLDNSFNNTDTIGISHDFTNELYSLLRSNQQVKKGARQLSKAEESIINTINTCLENWYDRWIDTFLANGREFKIVYDLMDGLLHYEDQITNCDSYLAEERTNAIAQAVARLVDYGNALLNIDLIIRKNDEISSEIDPVFMTTIELYQAHTKAYKLREKLLYDYFKKDKPNSSSSGILFDEATSQFMNGSSAQTTLQVPPNSTSNLSPKLERRHRLSIGSNTSVNTVPDGRKTPQQISPPSPSIPSPIDFRVNQTDSASQFEIDHFKNTMKSCAFTSPHDAKMRLALLPEIIDKIENLLTVPTNTDKVMICFELLDTLLDSIEKLPVESRKKEVLYIATRLIKPVVRKIYIDDRDNLLEFQQAHWTTCLISMIRLMTATDFNAYLKHFTNLADLGAFLKDYLFIAKRLVSTSDKTASAAQDIDNINSLTPTYPECWIEMILLASSTFLTSLTYLYQVLRQLFATNLQMWLSFIDCLIYIILQDTLKPDRLMLKKRQNLLAEDLRQTSAEYIWISWDSLSHEHKKELLEDLIEPLLRASIVLKTKQRCILLPIFYDMMRCDYTSQYFSQRISTGGSTSFNRQFYLKQDYLAYEDDLESLPPINHSAPSKTNDSMAYVSNEMSDDGTVLTKFTHLIISKLNILMFESDLGDENFKDELCAAMSGQLNPKYYDCKILDSHNDTGQFKSMAGHTSDLIAEFIQICLDSRQANKLAYKHLYLLCLFRLILFFRDKVDRIDLYLNNLYKLFYLHHTAKRYIEAGYTLLEHAKTLPWEEKPLENHYRIVTRYFQTSQQLTDYSSLKFFLYNTIIEYFDQGQLWEAAIPLCRELADIYQFKTFEYTKLAEILQRMSTYFSNITDMNVRNNPEYFRVTFYGIGFSKCIRNSTVVYRGKPYEKLGDFQTFILTKYPDCKLLNSLAEPDSSLMNEKDAKYLQINACTPLVDMKTKFNGKNLSGIGEFILNYYRYNECDKFQFSRRIERPSKFGGPSKNLDLDNFANMWRERTILTTNTLPGMLSFFQVFLIETSVVSPIESAIEDLERINDRLSCMVNRFRVDKRHKEDVRLLGQLLLGIVDAAVNGGIAKYETAFFTKSPTEMESSGHQINSQLQDTHNKQHQQQSVNNNYQQPVDNANIAQVDKLKSLIAHQVPLLDDAIRLHRDRVADVMRPQHEHLEASYKKLKHHIMTKYSRYLPQDYSRSTMRSYRSLARSPNRSIRSESRVPFMMPSSGVRTPTTLKRMSDVGTTSPLVSTLQKSMIQGLSLNDTNSSSGANEVVASSNIPYKQLGNERRSLPSLATDTIKNKVDIGCGVASAAPIRTSGNRFDCSTQLSSNFNPAFVATEFDDNCISNAKQPYMVEPESQGVYLRVGVDLQNNSSGNFGQDGGQFSGNTLDNSELLYEAMVREDGSIYQNRNSKPGLSMNLSGKKYDLEKRSPPEESEVTNLVLL